MAIKTSMIHQLDVQRWQHRCSELSQQVDAIRKERDALLEVAKKAAAMRAAYTTAVPGKVLKNLWDSWVELDKELDKYEVTRILVEK